MNLKIASLALVASALCCAECLALDTDVFSASQPLADARLEAAVTLDSYHPWEPCRDLASWETRAAQVRRQILVAAGLWPMPPRTPLEPVIHGRIDRGEYTIEKVFFQSLPGLYVTGSLYRPSADGGPKRPAVLSPHGHWASGRFYRRGEGEAKQQIEAGKETFLAGAVYPLQARCVHLARMDCVVFHYDMIGYADAAKQIPGHRDGLLDPDAELWLQSRFGLQTYNSIRALDFLASLPDVDASRIGVTGASGGGTQTFFLCAVDERPAAAFPAVMVSTAMQGGCVCENASHLRVGTGNIEFAALFAPRPLGLSGANDWTVEIETKGYPQLRALYEAYGHPERVMAKCFPQFEHNYNQVSRELMYAWFKKHLSLADRAPVEERDFEPTAPEHLSVFDEEHPLPPGAADLAELRRRLKSTSESQLAELAEVDAASLAEFRRVIGGALEAILHTSLPSSSDVAASYRAASPIRGARMDKLGLARRGTGEQVPAVLLTPRNYKGVVAVAVLDGGKAQLSGPEGGWRPEVDACLRRGVAILAPDVFLTGESLSARREKVRAAASGDLPAAAAAELLPVDAQRHGSYVGYTYGYNRTLIAQRVHDVLTAIAFARSLPGAKEVRLVGSGSRSGGVWALLARAVSGDAVGRTVVEADLDALSVESFQDENFLPGALKYGGLPFFAALCAPGELLILGSGEMPDVALAAYRAAGAEAKLRSLEPAAPALERMVDWICE